MRRRLLVSVVLLAGAMTLLPGSASAGPVGIAPTRHPVEGVAGEPNTPVEAQRGGPYDAGAVAERDQALDGSDVADLDLASSILIAVAVSGMPAISFAGVGIAVLGRSPAPTKPASRPNR